MARINIMKEVAVDRETIKVMVDENCITRTMKKEMHIELPENSKEIYLKGLVVKTNKIELNENEHEYTLLWKQNYIYVGILVAAIFMIAYKVLLGDGSYTSSERIVLLFTAGLAIKLSWNDLLILGRKISIKK